ncbi:MAG: sugar phosphate nucleotidyltransferase [Steroidobacteraceae bacterium]
MTRCNQTATDPNTLALVLAGGNGTRLGNLTADECKPALSFGGHFRNIDFTLSNCVHSGVRRIGVLTQYKPHTLIEHLSTGWNWLPRAMGEFVDILTAQQRSRSGRYWGTAHAVIENIDFIANDPGDQVLVLVGDHIYKMDYRPLLAHHRRSGADITVACVPVPAVEANQLGVLTIDNDDLATSFMEKPQSLPDTAISNGQVLASMGIYVISKRFLFSHLTETVMQPESEFDFGRHVLPVAVAKSRVSVYTFKDSQGRVQYWRDVGTLDAYWHAHMDLLLQPPPINLHDCEWPFLTATDSAPPARVLTPPDCRGLVANSLLGSGTVVDHAQLDLTVLSTRSTIGVGSRLDECVVLPGATIGARCQLWRTVVGAGAVIADDTLVGAGHTTLPRIPNSVYGVTLLTKHCQLDATRVAA